MAPTNSVLAAAVLVLSRGALAPLHEARICAIVLIKEKVRMPALARRSASFFIVRLKSEYVND